MINQTTKQTDGHSRKKVLAIASTFVPMDYNFSPDGFNSWSEHIKKEVHATPKESTNTIRYQKLFLNVHKR